MIKDRLLEFINAEQISASRLAEVIDVQASSISHIMSGRNKPGFDFLVKLFAAYPNLNPKWLMMGSGRMYASISKDSNVLGQAKVENINDQQQELPTIMDEIITDLDSREVEKVILFFSDKTFETYKNK